MSNIKNVILHKLFRMKYYILYLSIAVILMSGCKQTGPYPEGTLNALVRLTTQAEVDDFCKKNVKEITEGLFIGSSAVVNDPITDLSGLNLLCSLGGGLYITNNPKLTSLNGLENLTRFDALLEISGNPLLTDIEIVKNFTSIRFGLLITSNNSLTSLESISNITSIKGNLDISDNDALVNLEGLGNLTEVIGDLLIFSNDNLTDFCALQSLLINDAVAGQFTALANEYNPTLQEMIDGNCKS